ncbi:MAG: GTP cyclohydrolase IIa [Nitrososphaerales archaeon]|nr:GTP cyclohydrolase IIa [Nitrososphaerales archaeon]MCX8192133.1 GTP cyclohydrolase IIa [Nitrososphaerales archaeon]
MIRVGIVRLDGYENWIKSLGYDREWVVQATQADVYKNLVIESANVGLFSFPLTYDSYLTVVNASDLEDFKIVAHSISKVVPTHLIVYFGLGSTYVEAMMNSKELKDFEDRGSNTLEETLVAHLDLNGYNRSLADKGIYHVERIVNRVVQKLRRISRRYGGLAYYAGGDNVICFIPHMYLEGFIKDVKMDDIKIGVGIALRPRDALALATNALENIRLKSSRSRVFILKERP